MNKEIVIVAAREEHFEIAGDIAIKAWTPIHEEYKRLLGEEIHKTFFDDWRDKKKNSIINNLKTQRGYVALVDNVVAGFISYRVNENTKTGEIMGNAVDDKFRGMGIGTMMYEFVIDKMRQEGMVGVAVTTGGDDAHAPARRSYEKAGFEKFLPSVKYYKKFK